MVRGLDHFREHFVGYSDRYELIGGTAATVTMEEAGLAFRATKDLDILLVVEALDTAFGERMWQFVNQSGYEIWQASSGHPRLYRLEKPTDAAHPHMSCSRGGSTIWRWATVRNFGHFGYHAQTVETPPETGLRLIGAQRNCDGDSVLIEAR